MLPPRPCVIGAGSTPGSGAKGRSNGVGGTGFLTAGAAIISSRSGAGGALLADGTGFTAGAGGGLGVAGIDGLVIGVGGFCLLLELVFVGVWPLWKGPRSRSG